jgi:hypothetical protein
MELPSEMIKIPTMNVVVKNSSNRHKTKEDIETLVKVYSHQAIFRSSPYALLSFKQIAHSLLEVEIRRCELTNANILADCVNIRVVCLASNKITSFPKCFEKLLNLEIINFANNEITTLSEVSNLRLAPKTLTYINLSGNEVTSKKNYRRHIYELAPSISALDKYVIADVETLSYTSHFKHLNVHNCRSSMIVDITLYSIQAEDNAAQNTKMIATKCSAIRQIRKSVSPAYAIQKTYRRWTANKEEDVRYELFLGTIIKLQALVRSFLWSRELKREIDGIIEQEQEDVSVSFLQTMARVNQIKWRTGQLVRWARKYLRHRKQYKNSVLIQRWFHRSIRYHKGLIQWLRYKHVTGILFTEPQLLKVKACLASHPSRFVKSMQIQPFDDHLICVRTNGRDIFYRKETLKRISGPPARACGRKDVSVMSLQGGSELQRRRCRLLRRRGVYYDTKPSRSTACGTHSKTQDFISKHRRVFQLQIADKSLLLKIFKYLQKGVLGRDSIPVYLDSIEERNSCATDIQRMWRSFIVRKVVTPMFLSSLIGRRSVITVQRWWRNINSFKRRLNLLRDMNRTCQSITSPIIYLDVWVYYHLLRCYNRPNNQLDVVYSFPEFGGIPVFDDDNGHIAIQPYRPNRPSASASVRGISIKVPSTREGKARMCIPRWASWRPKQQLAPSTKAPLTHHVLLFSLLTLHCHLVVRSFDVPFKLSHQLKRVRKIRVMEMKFASVLEAQTRCAMLMLLTYDVKSHTSVCMMPEKQLQLR